jgi:16S rRNA (cytosine1402-N4)-methyltransferase
MGPSANKGEQEQSGYHIPVMLKEAVDALAVKANGIYVDCTFGGGGHSREILSRLGPEGRLFAFDQDEAARANLPDDPRIAFQPYNFRHIGRILRLHEVNEVDGILADLGVSSHQFDEAERGFSTRFDAELDMRMDRRQLQTAAALLNGTSEQELVRILGEYGEVSNSKTLARTIVAYRATVPFHTINQFKEAVQGVVKGNPHKYFAQVFQALRIAVNDELGALREVLEQVPAMLRPGGRIAVITFHSLEDRIVKTFFKNGSFSDIPTDEIYGTRQESPFNIISRKPILPSAEEIRKNPRSRSAKLRVAEKKTG